VINAKGFYLLLYLMALRTSSLSPLKLHSTYLILIRFQTFLTVNLSNDEDVLSNLDDHDVGTLKQTSVRFFYPGTMMRTC